jgi:hypothetical protein
VSAPGRQESHSGPSRVLMQVWAKRYSAKRYSVVLGPHGSVAPIVL